MQLNPITIAWAIFALIAIRFAIRMADSGHATLGDYLLMGAAGMVAAGLIAIAGHFYRPHGRRPSRRSRTFE